MHISQLREQPENQIDSSEMKVGDFYIDCGYHPCVAIEVDAENDELAGVSLVDGSQPRYCSFYHCNPISVSPQNAIYFLMNGPDKDDPIRAHAEHPDIIEMCGEPWWNKKKDIF